jgi:hypothetical protein
MASNSLNTTPNGTTVVDVNSVIGLSTTMVVDSASTPYIDNLLVLNPTITTFIFQPGTYKLINIFKILQPNIKFVGYTGVARDVMILQTMNYDGILLSSDSIVLQDISIKCTFSQKVTLTVSSANNTLVSGCWLYCSSDTFGIYYAGPSNLVAGTSTIDAYNGYNLDTGNIFYNNIVYANFTGDSVAFCLQYNSQFVKNFIRGGKAAIYMCRTCNVYNNTIMDSNSNGLFVSLPSDNLTITCNKICNSTYSGLVVKDQLEHGSFTRYSYNIIINYNTIFGSKFYGMELNNGTDFIVANNKIVAGSLMGIYSYNGASVSIESNKIAYFTHGVFLENNIGGDIKSNDIMSMYPNFGQNGIKLTNTTTNITVNNNNMDGMYLYDLIADSGIGNTISSNTISPNYTMDDEKNIYNIY